LILAAAEDQYYRERVAPHVDGRHIVYYGEADFAAKVKLYGAARALLYPIQAREPFGLVLAEAMACGTPVAALDRGAVREVVDDGARVVVLCASKGEAGSISDPALVPDGDLGRVRTRELQDAAAVLGVAETIVCNYPDGDLRWEAVDELHDEIVGAIRRYRPD